jgi:NADPH:quinone reductase-like Zn-dependent oxidoreductase
MKTWIVPAGSTSGADGLRQIDRTVPSPAHGEVRVAMRAWSINYRDLGVAAGKYFGGPVKRDTIPLSDGAGVVEEVGPGVITWKPGDRVAGTFFQGWEGGPFHGGAPATALGGAIDGVLAQQVVLEERGLVRIPDMLSFEEAACLPCAGLTAWSAVCDVARTMPGQNVLVLGTGGVSLFALQFAKAAGARVIITSSSDEKLARAKQMGADVTINYRTRPDWELAVLEATGQRGVDLVVEVGGAGTLPRSMKAAAPGGIIAVIGVVSGGGEINPVPLIPKALRMQGIYVGHRSAFEQMNAAITQHKLKPVIDQRMGFDQAPDAWRALPKGEHFGKIVIVA